MIKKVSKSAPNVLSMISIKKISVSFATMMKKKKYKIKSMLWNIKQIHVVYAMVTCMKMVYVFIVTINYI